jgi:glutathione synthase/RimK-type ligase-like ATP-grasp enzyme
MISQTYTVLAVGAMKRSLVESVRKLEREHPELGTPELAILTNRPEAYRKFEAQGVKVLECDFTPKQIKRQLAEVENIKAVICRGDMYVQYLRQVVPLLPAGVPVSSAKSLRTSTNKRLMREAFARACPQYTPKHLQISSVDDCARAARHLTFPVIVKPASLASSLMIQQCYDAAELRTVATKALKQLAKVYQKEQRSEEPELIVEEFLEGDFYSIDSYVLRPGQVWHTPPVWYVPAKQLGIDDFYLYKRIMPTALSAEETGQAQTVAEAAIAAAGLQYTSVHVELVLTRSDGWKIIEIGPRLGRFRNIMYRESCGIDHSYNDLRVHVGLEPELAPKSRPEYCAAYSIYPERAGVLKEVTGLAQLRKKTKSVVYFVDKSQPGARVYPAKSGGHSLCEVIFASSSKATFDADCAWFEKHVAAKLEPLRVTRQPAVLGSLVKVAIPSLGVPGVLAKVDTGAFSGALHCSDIREVDGTLYFTPLGDPALATSTRLYQKRKVRSASGHAAKRYLVPVRLKIHGKAYDTLIGLSERSRMKREMLIGRRFLLDHNIMVDVTLSHKLDFEAKGKS